MNKEEGEELELLISNLLDSSSKEAAKQVLHEYVDNLCSDYYGDGWDDGYHKATMYRE